MANPIDLLMGQVRGLIGDVSPEQMFEQAKLTVLATIRDNPPESYFVKMEQERYSRESALALWRFCYSQGALVEVTLAHAMASGKAVQ